MYLCMYVFMYVCVYVCMYACMYVCLLPPPSRHPNKDCAQRACTPPSGLEAIKPLALT